MRRQTGEQASEQGIPAAVGGLAGAGLAVALSAGLVGCPWWSPPDATDTSGMSGRLVDASGAPVVDQLVETVESTVRTGPDGEFGLYYKPPDTHIHFTRDDTWFRRAYRPDDEGTVVEVRLPETRALDVDCGAFTCALQLTWELGPSFTARRNGRCEAGKTTTLPGSPEGEPTAVSCREKVTEPELALSWRRVGNRLDLLPPLRDLVVKVVGDEGVPTCQVYVDDTQLASRDDGAFTGSGRDGAVVQAVCEGRAAIPVSVPPGAGEVEVGWMNEGPTLRPPPGMELDRLQLVQSGGWTLLHRADRGGGFALPPLPAGSYTIQLYTSEPAEVPVDKPSGLEHGVVVGQLLPGGQYAAHLALEHDIGDGVLDATLNRD
ncbi:MAG: hypothetical protein R3F61_34880 [Myxococcota bacterium]